jgi:hypothetical protein
LIAASSPWIATARGGPPSHIGKVYSAVVRQLEPFGVPPDDVVITLLELPMENWGVNGGIPASEIDVGFEVDI